MASSDYSTRGGGSFATVANLSVGVGPLDTTFPFTALRTANGDVRVIGEGILIGNEIARLVEFNESTFTVARGCADTIPATHAAGTPIWFYEEAVGTDRQVYTGGQKVSVKVRPRTISSAPVSVANSPPNPLSFNWRFFRPYPPGRLMVNGAPWFSSALKIDDAQQSLSFTWAHRHRVMQGDQLIDHTQTSIGPEPGTTYRIDLCDATTGALIHSFNAGSGTNYSLTRADALAATGINPGAVTMYTLLFFTVRDGMTSLQPYRIDMQLTGPSTPYGLGYRLGQSLGGTTP